ncbi:MAG: hypothetical protein AB7I33_14080 [Gemmatimonadales bacterium]
MHAHRRTFLQFSAELTGYEEVVLEGSGLVDEYQALLERQAGPAVTDRFYATARRVLRVKDAQARAKAMRIDVMASPILWPLATALIVLWYQGSWTTPPASWYALAQTPPPKGVTPGHTFVPSARAYTAQLAYRAAGAHPPGANPTGFGSWALDPVFGDDLPAPKEPA